MKAHKLEKMLQFVIPVVFALLWGAFLLFTEF